MIQSNVETVQPRILGHVSVTGRAHLGGTVDCDLLEPVENPVLVGRRMRMVDVKLPRKKERHMVLIGI